MWSLVWYLLQTLGKLSLPFVREEGTISERRVSFRAKIFPIQLYNGLGSKHLFILQNLENLDGVHRDKDAQAGPSVQMTFH